MSRLREALMAIATSLYFAVVGPLLGFTLFVVWSLANLPPNLREMPLQLSEWLTSIQVLGIPCAVAGLLFEVGHRLLATLVRHRAGFALLGAASFGVVFSTPIAITFASGGHYRATLTVVVVLAVVTGAIIGASLPRRLLRLRRPQAAS